ncbi:hypothetical protein L249_2508 [Ophiocordyceps polyrhachis-furcata BCC 54312]|uniref:Uncharacterized protein n=1 Tax=Ophiocordyceps polyrhachis-furcata BCC 54312 TaxID=1330021 RepID=A0A367LP29_9HYPO|nr:hypothetical protein L249_2508 [Ophiocordyceps polyrhachis-furcata BCC 54312]
MLTALILRYKPRFPASPLPGPASRLRSSATALRGRPMNSATSSSSPIQPLRSRYGRLPYFPRLSLTLLFSLPGLKKKKKKKEKKKKILKQPLFFKTFPQVCAASPRFPSKHNPHVNLHSTSKSPCSDPHPLFSPSSISYSNVHASFFPIPYSH